MFFPQKKCFEYSKKYRSYRHKIEATFSDHIPIELEEIYNKKMTKILIASKLKYTILENLSIEKEIRRDIITIETDFLASYSSSNIG